MALISPNSTRALPASVSKVEESASFQPVEGGKIGALEMKKKEPPFLKFIDELRNLSSVAHAFQCRWDELQNHLDFICSAIEEREKQRVCPPQNQQQHVMTATVKETEISCSKAEKSVDSNLPNVRCEETEQKPISAKTLGDSLGSELDSICQSMNGRELRRYILLRVSDYKKLRQEVPAALKNAPNPAKLVLESIGKFYLQGKRAYVKDRPQIIARQAALFVLEFFLLMGGCDELEPSVKEEAEATALAWKNRIVIEGGLARANNADARGLLLLISCFGIPGMFTVEDLVHLLSVSNPREISEALRKSSFLVMRISDIVEAMKENEMHIEAVDVIYTFELEHKFSPMSILVSFLKNLKEACSEARKDAQASPLLRAKANEKQIAGLKSVLNCLEAHKVDPVKLLPGWNIKARIKSLEKGIAKQKQKTWEKRKADGLDKYVSPKIRSDKRPRVTGDAPASIPSPFSGSQGPKITNIPPYPPGSVFPHNFYDYPAASAWPHDYIRRSFLDNAVGTGIRTGLLPSGVPTGSSGFISASATGVQGAMLDSFGQSTSGNGYFHESLAVQAPPMGSRSFLGPSSSLERFPGLPEPSSIGVGDRRPSSDLYHFADSVLEGDYHSGLRRPSGTTDQIQYSSSFFY
ncbi:hypothetical protein Nepgr_022819 [Nepenthes gracilis]|uniref:FRIGIDA-like protein n=1 Tax=Nepenthes gracilis TaxID=150966 RepID=A0AAD3T1K8_NEPGR|nr:hypothetical protein Nepgr_022819 [Nepenthes gracilis]